MEDPNYYAAINKKIQTRRDINKQKLNLYNNESKITNKLLNYYDNLYDNNYDKNNDLNAFIKTRDRIININNDFFDDKLDTILIYKYFLYLISFIVLIILGQYLGIYSTETMYMIFLLSFIFYIVITYYHIYYNDYTLGEYRAVKFATDSTSSIFKNFAAAILPNFMTRNRCPKGCQHKGHLHPKYKVRDLDNAQIKEMSTDSTHWTTDGGKKYHCQWTDKEGEILGDQGYEFVGDIPCKYFPGYDIKKIY